MQAPKHRWSAALLLFGGVAVGAPSLSLPQDPHGETSAAASETLFLRAKRVIVRPGKVLENAQVLVEDGRIRAVGSDLTAPEGARVIEGEVVCAGFLDPWSSLGVDQAVLDDTRTDASTRTADGLDPFGTEYDREEARSAGVVAVRVQAGRLAPIGGYGAWISTAPGTDLDELLLLEDADVGAQAGLAARGTPSVFNRIASADKVCDTIRAGLDYDRAWVRYREELESWKVAIAEKEAQLEKDFKKAKKEREKAVAKAEEDGKEYKEKSYKEDKPPRMPKYDADKEAMARVANGEVPLVVECHRVAELRALLEGTRPFGRLRLIIAGGSEALEFADELAERRIPVIVFPKLDRTPLPGHVDDVGLALAGRLAEEEVPVLLGSGGTKASRDLPLLAEVAIGNGLDREEAFAALTSRAARVLDVADQLGTVERGRRADLLVLTGDPLVFNTSITHVLIDGQVVVAPKEDQ